MAAGKTTVGRLVAAKSGRPHFDLDQVIEKDSGLSVTEIFAARGEAGFRALERDTLRTLLDSPANPVVSLGGGALLDRATRLDALDRATVVTLEAPLDELVRRSSSSKKRPLLDVPDAHARAAELLEQRRGVYAESHARISTHQRTLDDIAKDVVEVWAREPVAVAAGSDSYVVEVGRHFATERLPSFVGGASSVLLVTDDNVDPLFGSGVEGALKQAGARTAKVVLTAGEEHKNARSLEQIWNAAQVASLDRKGRVVALGGGVVSDVAGFAAATWMRGVSWVGVPTTLLSMVDAAVGGKTAIDLGAAKNSVGAFWQPSAVLCDVHHLSTEPDRGYASALAEVIKTALIGDPELLTLVESRTREILDRDPDTVSEIVRRCVRVKARVVSLDPREETGLRACLNLGHTVGHALEAYGGYGHLTHGEAVSLGLVAALRIGERLGATEHALAERTIAALRALGLPIDVASQPVAAASALVGHDKKKSGNRLKFVVARAPGRVELVDLPLDELRRLVVELAS